MLGHYKWKFSVSDCEEMDKKTHTAYENKLSDWMAIEAIVRQKDKEITAASIAKLSGWSNQGKRMRLRSRQRLSHLDEFGSSFFLNKYWLLGH